MSHSECHPTTCSLSTIDIQAQQPLDDDDDDDVKTDIVAGPKPFVSAKNVAVPRARGKVVHCAEVENVESVTTLNGDIRVIDAAQDLMAWQHQNIFFSAAQRLQLRANDVVSFEIGTFEHGGPYALNIAVIKFGADPPRHSAHIEVIAADIMRCSVFMEQRHIDVEYRYCGAIRSDVAILKLCAFRCFFECNFSGYFPISNDCASAVTVQG